MNMKSYPSVLQLDLLKKAWVSRGPKAPTSVVVLIVLILKSDSLKILALLDDEDHLDLLRTPTMAEQLLEILLYIARR